MREIKYRGIPTDNNTSYDKEDGFVEGSLIIDNNKYYIVLEVIDNIKRDDYAIYMIEVIPETVGQYTGLEDKKGKEIYEGDIVKVFSMGDYTEGYVKYSSDKGRFDIGWKSEIKNYMKNEFVGSFAIMKNDYDLLEVIGNIYDNTELLGGSDGRD